MTKHAASLDDEKKERLTLIAMTVGGLIFGAIFGAIFLPMLYRFAAGILDWAPKPAFVRWYCALAGAGIGGFRGFSGARKQIRRRRATREIAENLGMEYSAEISDELENDLTELVRDNGSISISNAVHRNVDSARFVVADMRLRTSSGSDNSNVTHQTVAYFTSDRLHFPGFELQPEGMMLNLLANVMGLQDIDFEDYGEFSNQYHLSGAKPQQIRQLFGADLLQHFTGNAGWQIKAAGNRLLMFRPRKRYDPGQLEEFINEAMETFSLFMAASYDLQDASEAVPRDEASRTADGNQPPPDEVQGLPGLLATLAQRTMVTPNELDRFLTTPAPRQIPPEILRQRIGGGSLITAALGCIFFTAGMSLAGVALFAMGGPMDEEHLVVSILGTVFPLAGATMAFFAIRYRRLNYRLLRHGIVAEGKIEAVQRTSTTINNQRQFRLKVRFSDGLGQRSSTCNIYGKIVEDARRRHQADQAVRILYDRQAPQRILWADSFALAKF